MTRDPARAARAIDEFLRALGHEPDAEPDLRGTGARVAEAWLSDLLDGEAIDAAGLLAAESIESTSSADSVVVLRELEIATMCPHHLMPAMGQATVAYVPGERLVGLGALGRALDALAHRLTLQERIGEEFVEAITRSLGARGALCSLRLRHACMSARGSRKAAIVESLAVAGVFAAGGSHAHLVPGLVRP
jgi:GTP cyclohydrolase I